MQHLCLQFKESPILKIWSRFRKVGPSHFVKECVFATAFVNIFLLLRFKNHIVKSPQYSIPMTPLVFRNMFWQAKKRALHELAQ